MKGFRGLDICTIYDFETLSQNPVDGVVISFAMLNYDPMRFEKDPYTYQELVDKCNYIKFDVADQVKSYGRKIEKDTVRWWSEQNKEAQKKIDAVTALFAKQLEADKVFEELWQEEEAKEEAKVGAKEGRI